MHKTLKFVPFQVSQTTCDSNEEWQNDQSKGYESIFVLFICKNVNPKKCITRRSPSCTEDSLKFLPAWAKFNLTKNLLCIKQTITNQLLM